MCGSVVQADGAYRIALALSSAPPDSARGNLAPRYNGAPSQSLLIVRRNPDTSEVSADPLRWGLVPSWSDGTGPAPINARSETVATSPLFRRAYARRRALLPVDAFYEWMLRSGSNAKQPMAIGLADDSPSCLAALWENRQEPGTGAWTRSFAVLTTRANETVAEVHDRMPVIIPEADRARWLADEADSRDLLVPYPAEAMRLWPVSPRVNNPRNDDADLLMPAREASPTLPPDGNLA